MIFYREVQRFSQTWVRLPLILPPLFMGCGVWRQVINGHPFGSRPMPDQGLLLAFTLTSLFALWFWNVSLIIEVHDSTLEFVMRLLWRRRRIPLESIERAEPVTYRPILEYGGWGIRRGAQGWCYNVRGNRGVRLELAGGEKLLLGSQTPEDLARAILERKSTVAPSRPRL